MDGRKHKQPDSVDDKWKEGLDLVRIRHKAVLARLLYKRNDAKIQNKNKTIEEILERDLKAAENAEQRCFKEATSEQNYQERVNEYIQTSKRSCSPDTFQAALEVTSLGGDAHTNQLCPDLSDGSSEEAFVIRIWILLNSLQWMDALTRAKIWPKFEILLLLIGAHTNTVNAARQEVQLQLQQQQPLCLYVNDLLRSVESILEPNLQPHQPHHPHQPHQPQQQQGPDEIQMELHAVVMAFMKEII